jgi:hypothetical protein
MPISYLPFLIFGGVGMAVVALSGVIGFACSIHSKPFWISMACFVGGAAVGYESFARLERIHGELFRGRLDVKTKGDLLDRFGSPSRTKMLSHNGKQIECWIYEIRLLSPPVFAQFEMVDESITATVYSNI